MYTSAIQTAAFHCINLLPFSIFVQASHNFQILKIYKYSISFSLFVSILYNKTVSTRNPTTEETWLS